MAELKGLAAVIEQKIARLEQEREVYNRAMPDLVPQISEQIKVLPGWCGFYQHSVLWTRRDNDGTAGTGVIVTGDAALAAAKVLNGPIATSLFRAKWVIAGTSYTFSLIACLDRD
jgi:hypothetical protein